MMSSTGLSTIDPLFFSGTTFTDMLSGWGFYVGLLLLLIIVVQVALVFVLTCVKKIANTFTIMFFLFVAALILCLVGNFAVVQENETANSLNNANRSKSSETKNSASDSPNEIFQMFHQSGFHESDSKDEQNDQDFQYLKVSDSNQMVNRPSVTAPTENSFSAVPYRPGEINQTNTRSSDASGSTRSAEYSQPPYSVNTVPSGVKQPTYETSPNSSNSEGSPVTYQHKNSTDNNLRSALTPQIKTKIDKITSDEFNSIVSDSNEAKRQAILLSRASTVRIEAKVYRDKKNPKSRFSDETGSGILFQRDGHVFILTNYHVAGPAVSSESVNIFLRDERLLHPTKIFTCQEVDIALLEIPRSSLPQSVFSVPSGPVSDTDIFLARIGDSTSVREMDEVWSIGAPFGLTGSISRGVISARDRSDIQLGVPGQIQGFFQTDAAINPGNSGGPLVNVRGEVIAVVTAIASRNGNGSGIAFAIPINTAMKVVDQFVQTGQWKRGYLGLSFDSEYTNSERAQDGLIEAIGARVTKVDAGSPAESCGFLPNDVILSYDGVTIRDATQLTQLIGLSSPGHKPRIVLWRGNQKYGTEPELIGSSVYAANE